MAVKKEQKKHRLKGLQVSEVSFVDNPAVPKAKFLVIKNEDAENVVVESLDLVEADSGKTEEKKKIESPLEEVMDDIRDSLAIETKDVGSGVIASAKNLQNALRSFLGYDDKVAENGTEESEDSTATKSISDVVFKLYGLPSKSKEVTNYRDSLGESLGSCLECRFFKPPMVFEGEGNETARRLEAQCVLVEGTILPEKFCDLFEGIGTQKKEPDQEEILQGSFVILSETLKNIEELEKAGKVISSRNADKLTSAFTDIVSAFGSLKAILESAGIEIKGFNTLDESEILSKVWNLLIVGKHDEATVEIGLLLGKDVKGIGKELEDMTLAMKQIGFLVENIDELDEDVSKAIADCLEKLQTVTVG